jgi:hypothetical protein
MVQPSPAEQPSPADRPFFRVAAEAAVGLGRNRRGARLKHGA